MQSPVVLPPARGRLDPGALPRRRSARTTLWRRTSTATDAGSAVQVSLSAQPKGNLALLAYRGVDPGCACPSPPSWRPRRSSRQGYTGTQPRTSLTPPGGVSLRSNSSQSSGSGRATVRVADSGPSVPPDPYAGRAGCHRPDQPPGASRTLTIVALADAEFATATMPPPGPTGGALSANSMVIRPPADPVDRMR